MAIEEDSRFYDLLERLFKEIDQDSIQAEIAALREARPHTPREKLAEELIKKSSKRVAAIGAAAGMAVGPLAVLAMAPDIFNLVLQQSRLILSIAFLYDRKPNLKQRFKEVLATLAVATGASAGGLGARVLVAKGLEQAAAAKIARKIFGRFLARRIPAAAPMIGTIAGGTINYMSMRAVGKAALAFYSDEAGDDSQ
ncbi:MAG TPA: hypothetical protein VF846_16840 [Thermoanaerobaculia bacterium]